MVVGRIKGGAVHFRLVALALTSAGGRFTMGAGGLPRPFTKDDSAIEE